MSSKMHRLNGLEGAQSTGKAFLACMSGKMILQMTQVTPNLTATDVTLLENTIAMKLLHMSVAFILVNKLLVTDGARCRFPGRRDGFGSRGTGGTSFERGLRRKLDLERRNPFTRGGGLRLLSGETRVRIIDWNRVWDGDRGAAKEGRRGTDTRANRVGQDTGFNTSINHSLESSPGGQSGGRNRWSNHLGERDGKGRKGRRRDRFTGDDQGGWRRRGTRE